MHDRGSCFWGVGEGGEREWGCIITDFIGNAASTAHFYRVIGEQQTRKVSTTKLSD